MPQLNPAPWLLIMLASWLTLTLIVQPKLLFFTSTNILPNKPITTINLSPWNWPWS
uniref:ATP synthase complex subunit 8 n=2 Tax=Aquila TaxID=8960 RepID=A0A342RPH4_AQUHE|nr:ATP synthase F0 subunit 8 [Aquila chrysaetos]YP_009424012.1 ATP synthase F0 subunit 8 [Aquila heliaca]AHL16796.1 ATP synthase F0 subunit 8 [Aquila chrysaetos]AOG66032.1 ATP synthase F0 subunit 8 [Aquila heliaca]WAK85356.1 ATP synthase F0 subunit 8 [Aquila chrysaetos canadensis]